MEIKSLLLPNLGVVQGRFDADTIKELWNLIELAKINNKNKKDSLAGNISSSLDLDISRGGFLSKLIFPMIEQYVKSFGNAYQPLKSNVKDSHISLNDLWVNFQYENEFNPMHKHSGAFSFVIWLKIPTNHIDQAKLKIASESNEKNKISNFTLIYTDIIGNIVEQVYEMEPDKEGVILLFPARLRHQVYPFYNCKDPRVSISGNFSVEHK